MRMRAALKLPLSLLEDKPMKVKFLEDYKPFCRGMQYPMEQVGQELAEKLQAEGKARIFPLPEEATVEVPAETPVEVVKPAAKKGKR
jgi:hypothetical protein